MEPFKTMIHPKTFGAVLFVGVSLVAYGCNNDDDKVASTPVPDAGATTDSGLTPATEDGGTCKDTQVPSDYERCFTFDSKVLPGAQPVTTQCLPAALASERPTGRVYGDLAFGNFVLAEAYDLSGDCATKTKTVAESVRYFDIYLDVVSQYSARSDGAIGKTAAQYPRLPPPEADPDAGDAGTPPLAPLAFAEHNCPPVWPQVKCIDLRPWFEGGAFFTATATELRLFKNLPGTGDAGAPDASTAQLYAVYKKVQ